MLFPTLLLLIVAVADEVAYPQWLNSKDTLKEFFRNPNSINVTEYYHMARALYEDILVGRKTVSIQRQWAMREISSENFALFWGKTVLHGVRHFVGRSVHLLTHFQIPLGKTDNPSAKKNVYLVFLHSSELEFHWDSDILSNSQFQFVKTTQKNATHHQEIYKVVGRPGSLVPLRLMVININKSKTFSMEWTLSPGLDNRKSLALQLVKLITPRVVRHQDVFYSSETKISTDLRDLGPLVPSLQASTLQNLVKRVDKSGGIVLEGWFLPTQAHNKFVLSSSVPVSFAIATKCDMVPLLVAGKGVSSELEVVLSPNKFKRICLSVDLSDRDVLGFSLQVYTPGTEAEHSSVSLKIPVEKEQEQIKYERWPGNVFR